MFQALSVRDFRLLWAGGLVSSLGSWLLVLALPAHVFTATGSLRDTGLTLAAEYLPQLVLGPAAGAIADRRDRRHLMIAASLCCAGSVAVMLLGTSPGRLWILYVALIGENSGAALYSPALQARVPAIVGTGPLLSSANSLSAVSGVVVRLIGGPLGGFLLALCGIQWLIRADAASYLAVAGAIAMTSRSPRARRSPGARRSRDPRPPRNATIRGAVRDLAEGTRVLRAQPAARALLPVTVVFLAANASLTAVLMPFGLRHLGGSEQTGLLLSGLGAGFLLGAPVTRMLVDRIQPRNLLSVSLIAEAGAYLLLFTSSSLVVALPAAVAVALSGSVTLTAQQTTVQRVIANAALGRVTAVFLTGEAAATLAGAAAGPFLAETLDLTGLAAAAALFTGTAAALAFLRIPRTPGPAGACEHHPGDTGPGARGYGT